MELYVAIGLALLALVILIRRRNRVSHQRYHRTGRAYVVPMRSYPRSTTSRRSTSSSSDTSSSFIGYSETSDSCGGGGDGGCGGGD